MADYIIGEEYSIPSHGKIYKGQNVSELVKLRSMTTNEEMKRLNPTDKPYKAMAEIIDGCLVKDPGISSYDMCLGDYQFLLYKLRVVTYGPHYNVVCKCPYCLTSSEEVVDLETLPVNEYKEDIENQLEFDLPRTKHHIRLRMQTPRMIEEIEAQVKDFKKKAKSFDGDSAFLFSLKESIIEIDNEKVDPIHIEQWIRDLPAADANYIKRKAQKLNGAIGIENQLTVVCDVCGLSYDSSFRTSSDFFDPAIDE